MLRDDAKLKKFQTSKKIWKWVGGSRTIWIKNIKLENQKKLKSLMIIGFQKKTNWMGGGFCELYPNFFNVI